MAALKWDQDSFRFYETGTSHGVLYVKKADGTYDKGVAWNGLTAFSESPSGAEETELYANDKKYGSLRSAEKFGGTIEAYTYPEEFEQCDGSMEVATGVTIGQQPRSAFGFTYRTVVGNDVSDAKFIQTKIEAAQNCITFLQAVMEDKKIKSSSTGLSFGTHLFLRLRNLMLLLMIHPKLLLLAGNWLLHLLKLQ